MLAQLYSAMRLPHCELGSRLFPRSLQPLNHQTRSPTTDEQACPPPGATWSSPPHQHHAEEACHLHPEAFCKQLLKSHATSPFSQAILLTQSAPDIGAHLLSPNSEACGAEDRCLRVSNGQETHVTAPLQSQTPQTLFWHGPNERRSRLVRSVAHRWTRNSTTAMGVDTEAASIAGMPQWPDALLMWYTHTTAQRCTSSSPCQPSLVW